MNKNNFKNTINNARENDFKLKSHIEKLKAKFTTNSINSSIPTINPGVNRANMIKITGKVSDFTNIPFPVNNNIFLRNTKTSRLSFFPKKIQVKDKNNFLKRLNSSSQATFDSPFKKYGSCSINYDNVAETLIDDKIAENSNSNESPNTADPNSKLQTEQTKFSLNNSSGFQTASLMKNSPQATKNLKANKKSTAFNSKSKYKYNYIYAYIYTYL